MLLLFTVVSCNNEDSFDCFKTTGTHIELEIPSEPFNRLEIRDGMDIYLKNGPERRIVVKGGKNLLPKVKIAFEDNTMKIDNENKYNWTRKYEKIEMYITAPLINEIIHYGFGNVVSLDTLKSKNFRIVGQESSGDFNLILDTQNLYFISNGLSIATISGKTDQLSVGHYFNNGIFNGENLIANNVYVDHQGYTRIRVRVENSLSGSILQNGSLEYISNSALVEVEVFGKGTLIHIGS